MIVLSMHHEESYALLSMTPPVNRMAKSQTLEIAVTLRVDGKGGTGSGASGILQSLTWRSMRKLATAPTPQQGGKQVKLYVLFWTLLTCCVSSSLAFNGDLITLCALRSLPILVHSGC